MRCCRNPRFPVSPMAAAVAFSVGFGLPLAQAQEKILEEVIITSQKRAQSIMDVPISVSAVTGEKMEKAGIENIEDLTAYVPNVHLTETGLSTQLRIRGIGSDNSQGFEQSVGVYMDGVFRGRAQLFRAPIFDVERVEVMRGPQNILFGKNSVAGAIDVISAKPQDEFSGKLTASYESEYGTQELSGFLTGRLTQGLNARLAVRQYDDPGYMENTFKDTDEPDQNESSVRGSIDWAVTDNFSALLIIEHDTLDIQGRAVEITQDLPSINPALGGANYQMILASVNSGVSFESNLDYRRQTDAPEYSDNTIDSQTLVLDYQWDDYTLTSTTGLLKFDYLENCDCDFTAAPIFDLDLMEEYEQISQEIRIVSPLGGNVDWIAGAFYQSFEQSFADTLNVTDQTPLTTILAPALNPSLSAYGLDANVLGNTGVSRAFEQTSDAWALFAEFTWHLRDAVHLTLGARYTEEEKEGTKLLNVVDITDGTPVPVGHPLLSPVLGNLYFQVFGAYTEQFAAGGGHNLAETRDESAFMPSVTLAWDANDELMVYAKYARGFKAGGFDPRSNDNSRFEFEDEEVSALEMGSKWVLADGKGELNTALFYSDYENLQTSQFDGHVGFNVGNADARVSGLELDGRWQISDHWLAAFGASYLNFEYTDYTDGNCYFNQTPDNGVFCDNTGKSSTYVPDLTFNGSLSYERPISNTLNFVTVMDMQWVDEQQVHNNLDPLGVIDAYTLLGLRMAVEAEHWELALLGKNLLDEDVLTVSSNMPLSESLFGTNSYYSFVRRPMTVALEATVKF